MNTRAGELSYLVDERAIEQLPLNGRNYTDLACLQPGVMPFPHRDGGSVVAHGLGMSVNGQDPRANVYLLDGTLQNDLTNGPAGSAAGTALGMETVQEFRVETNAYSAEFGRMSGGQVNVLTKSGTNAVRGSAFEFHRNDALDAQNYFDVGDKPAFTRNQFGGTVGGPLRQDKLFYFVGYEGLRENLGRTITSSVPDDNARQRPAARSRRTRDSSSTSASTRPSRRTSTSIRCRTAPTSATAPRSTASSSTRRSTRTSCRAASTTTLAPGAPVLRALHLRRCRASGCRPTTRSSRATFVSRNQFFTGEYRAGALVEPAQHVPRRLQPHARRPGRRGQHRAAAVRAGPRATSATSTSAACSASARRAPPTCGFLQNVFSVQADLALDARAGTW